METEWVDVLFLQETINLIDLVIPVLESPVPRWQFHALDVRGRSSGIAFGFNPRTIRLLNVWGRNGCIGANIF